MLQEDPITKRMHPVPYVGPKLSPTEQNYAVQGNELLAIKHSLRTWYQYIGNSYTKIFLTDHESLKYLQTLKRPSPRLVRWIDQFKKYSPDIRYRPRSEAIAPDSISRRPDFLNFMTDWANTTWSKYMVEFLQSNTLPDNYKVHVMLKSEGDKFRIEDD